MEGSTWVKIDTRDSATRPFLSREFSTRCLLSSDGHFHKITFILRHATSWKKNKNDVRHFNINMIWHPTPQITYDSTPDRAQLCLIPQCINSYQLNKIPSYCTTHVSLRALKAFVMERLCCTTHRPSSECVVVPCSYTSLCVNRKECKQHLATECIFQTSVFFFFFFSEWETEKGKMLGNISFCLNIHWCWWNRNCKYKYKHAYSAKTAFFLLFFFFFYSTSVPATA